MKLVQGDTLPQDTNPLCGGCDYRFLSGTKDTTPKATYGGSSSRSFRSTLSISVPTPTTMQFDAGIYPTRVRLSNKHFEHRKKKPRSVDCCARISQRHAMNSNTSLRTLVWFGNLFTAKAPSLAHYFRSRKTVATVERLPPLATKLSPLARVTRHLNQSI